MDDLSVELIEDRALLREFDNELTFCTRGVSLSSKQTNTGLITEGLSQLRYALPFLIAQEANTQLTVASDEGCHICFVCGILVTTSDLYVLKQGLSLTQFSGSTDLRAVSDKVAAVVAYQELGPQVAAHCRVAMAMLKKDYPAFDARIKEVGDIRAPGGKESIRPGSTIYEQFFNVCSRIFVVGFESIDWFLSLLRERIYETGKNRKRVMTIELNRESYDRHFKPISQLPPV